MTSRTHHPAFSVVSDMENDVANIRRWSQVLYAMAGSGLSLDAGALHVIADGVEELAGRLQTQWDQAFDLVRDNP